jgi:tRNA A37 methylthiotransferase MiaB
VCVTYCNGCPRSQVETARLLCYFEANGWTIGRNLARSDLVIVSACAVASEVEEESLRGIALADRRRRHGSRLVVVGCVAGIIEDRLRETFGALAVPPMRLSELDAIIGATVPIDTISDQNDVGPFPGRVPSPFGSAASRRLHHAIVRARSSLAARRWPERRHSRGFTTLEPCGDVHSVRVASGCLEDCSFCAIGTVEGPLRSKSLARVLMEFDQGLALGRTEFRLIGTDVGAYGQDIGTNYVDLLESIFARSADFRLTILDTHPRWLIRYEDSLIPLLAANTSRVRLLMMPVQSGSERMLELMRRGHTAAELTRSLRALRLLVPGLALGTHVLVGFPGESDQDFEDTCRLLDEAAFDRVSIYGYSDRPKTDAARLPNKVPDDVSAGRVSRLLKSLPNASAVT